MLPRQIRHHNNGIVFLKDIYAYKCYGPAINIKEHFLKPTQEAFLQNLHAIDFVDRAYKYFYDRLEGNVDQIDVKNAYQNKKKYSIEQLKSIYPKVDIRKKMLLSCHMRSLTHLMLVRGYYLMTIMISWKKR